LRGSDNAFAQEAPDPIEGVWEAQVTIRDCTTSAARATFQGVEVFHRGGTISDTDSAPTATRGPGFGTWAKSGSDYIVKFRFFTYDPTTGVVSGVIRTTRTVTVGTDGKHRPLSTPRWSSTCGALVRSDCGTDTETKVL